MRSTITAKKPRKKTKGAIYIDRNLCKGCGYCVVSCPKGVIEIESSYNEMGCFPARVANPRGCIGCAKCAHMCPEIAIEVWREE